MPEFVKQIDKKPTNVCSILILIGHDQNTAVTECFHIRVFLPRFKTEDLFHICDFFSLFNLPNGSVLDIEKFPPKREDSILLSLFLREP